LDISCVEEDALVVQLLNTFNHVEVVVLGREVYNSKAIASSVLQHDSLTQIIVNSCEWGRGMIHSGSGPLGLQWDRVHFREVFLEDDGPAVQNMPITPLSGTPSIHTLFLTGRECPWEYRFPWTAYRFRGLHQITGWLENATSTWDIGPVTAIVDRFLSQHPLTLLSFPSLSNLKSLSITGVGEIAQLLDGHPRFRAGDIVLRKREEQVTWYIAEISVLMLGGEHLSEHSSSVLELMDSVLPMLEGIKIATENPPQANIEVSDEYIKILPLALKLMTSFIDLVL
jgi:hypothetical protein